MKRLITLIAIGVALAIPAQASALSTRQVIAIVKKGFTNQVRARSELAGYKFLGDNVKCIYTGQHAWTCYATYSVKKNGYVFKYGVYIDVTRNAWKTVGNATLVKAS